MFERKEHFLLITLSFPVVVCYAANLTIVLNRAAIGQMREACPFFFELIPKFKVVSEPRKTLKHCFLWQDDQTSGSAII